MPFKQNPEDLFDTEAREGALNSQGLEFNENRLAPVDHDQSTVLEYLHNRTKVGVGVKDPINAPDDLGSQVIDQIPQEVVLYEKEQKELESLDSSEIEERLNQVEEKSKENVGLFSKGKLLSGFAIDPETLRYIETRDHDKASIIGDLIDKLVYHYGFEYHPDLEKRIVGGLIYKNVDGFKTPIVVINRGILQMGDLIQEDILNKIKNAIYSSRKYLVYTRPMIDLNKS